MWRDVSMTGIFAVWALLFALLVGLVVGLTIRARRRLHPHCRRCHHDLGPRTATLPAVCPECGRPLDRFMAVRRGPRLRHGFIAGIAIVVLLVGGATIARLARSISRGDMIASMPNWAIRVIRPAASKSLAEELVQELAERARDDAVGDAELEVLARHVLDDVLPPLTDAGPTPGFLDPLSSGGWVGPIARADRAGLLDEDDLARLAAARTGHAIVGVATPSPDTLAVQLIVIDRWMPDRANHDVRAPGDPGRAPWDPDASITLHVEGIEIGADVVVETAWMLELDERDVQSEQALHLLTDPRLARITAPPHAVGRLELRSADGTETITHRFRTPIGGATVPAPVSFDLQALEADVATAFDGARVAPLRLGWEDEPIRSWYLNVGPRASGAPMIVHAARVQDGAGAWHALTVRPWKFGGGSMLGTGGVAVTGTARACAFDLLAQIDPESAAWVPLTIETSLAFVEPRAIESDAAQEPPEADADAAPESRHD